MAKKITQKTEAKIAAAEESQSAAAPSGIAVAVPEWGADYHLRTLGEDDLVKLNAFLRVSPDVVKKPGGVAAAFLAFVITDESGGRVFKTEDDVKTLLRRNPVVVARLLSAAQSVNGEELNTLLQQHKGESIYGKTPN